MKIQFQQIRNIVDSIFSESGYTINNLNIQFPHPLDIKIIRDDKDNIDLAFTQFMPKVTWKRFIKLTARIIGITLGENGGVLKLKYLPDIKFSYDDSQNEQLFGQTIDLSDIEGSICSEYADEEQRFIAKKCLHYAAEWSTIAGQGCDFASMDSISRRQLKKDCKNFVMDNLKNDPEIQAGSVIVTFLFFYVVLPVILKFVLERLFKKLFN